MNKRIIIILFIVTGLIGFGKQVQSADIYINDNSWCGAVLNSTGDTYILTTNLNCTEHGLVVGADGITIDGNGHTITGDSGSSDYGINDLSGYDTIIIQNFSNITDFGTGILLFNSSGSTIQDNIINSNSSYGIWLRNSFSNTLSGNSMSDNSYNLHVTGTTTTHYDNAIDTTNLVENKPVYYLYGHSNETYDGNIVGDIGLFWCISCDNVTVQNATFPTNNFSDVFFYDTDNSYITNITVNSSRRYGIHLKNSTLNTLTNNIADSNGSYGIYLESSSSNTLSGNSMSGNTSSNLYVSGTVTTDYDNSINTTNLVEDKPVYYLYGHTNETYDGNIVGDIGLFWCISCDNMTVRNATLPAKNYYGVFFYDTDNSYITNITVSSNNRGIFLNSSNLNTLTNNTSTSNSNSGISLDNSHYNDLLQNITNSNYANETNRYGISLKNSTYNELINNTANLNSTGIYLDGSNNNELTSNTVNSNNAGITLSASSYNIITGNTANSNFANNQYSITLYSSNYNDLIDNTANFNNTGIYLYTSNNNELTGNTTNSNYSYGIYLKESSPNTLSGNSMSSNSYNLYVTGTTAQYNNTINTTNLVEGKPIYYLYNHSGETYDGNIVGDIGAFWCISCNNVTVRNTTLSPNNYYGVFFYNTDNSYITNVTANSNNYGIYLSSSDSNNISNSVTNSNYNYGIYLAYSLSNELTGNTISNNKSDFYDSNIASNTYQDNRFLYNLFSTMIDFTETDRNKDLNDDNTVTFDVSMFDVKGNSCPDCTPSIATNPEETVDSSINGNDITGSFTVTRPGIYSLIVSVTDADNNLSKRNYLFFIETYGSKKTRYYIRGNRNPMHGKVIGTGADSKSLLLEAPTKWEKANCAIWVQNSPDDIPDFPLSNLSSIDAYAWYSVGLIQGEDTFMGVERFATYTTYVKKQESVPVTNGSEWGNSNFTDLNWAMDYPFSWYWVALKLFGSGANWITFPSEEYQNQPSYADFYYQYTTSPAIKSISNTDIIVLSATEPENEPDNATIVLDGTGATDTSVDIVLDNYNRPFLGYTTTINSNGTATLQANDITGQTTINSVNIDITPDFGSVDVDITTWQTSGSYYKEWTETASVPGITAEHIIGDLVPNNYYSVIKDGALIGMYLSDSSGKTAFISPVGSVFAVTSVDTVFDTDNENSDEGGFTKCFIATAAYGTPMAGEVKILSKFRDEYLLANPIGEGFVAAYYKLSPNIADFIREHPTLKKIVRITLNPLIWMIDKSIEE